MVESHIRHRLSLSPNMFTAFTLSNMLEAVEILRAALYQLYLSGYIFAMLMPSAYVNTLLLEATLLS